MAESMTLLLPSGYRALIFDEIDSTNEEVRRRAAAGEAGNLFILARRQTAGRGRRGREWQSPRGNFHATLLLRPPVTPQKSAELSFVAANTVAETIETLGVPRASVKWPNDVLVDGAKIAGILLESSARHPAQLEWIAIGIGINLAHAPERIPAQATSVAIRTGRAAPDAAEVLAILARAFAGRYDIWMSQGFAPTRAEWLSRAHGLGERIVARLEREEVAGTFLDVNDAGAILIGTPDGVRAISSGEVFFARIN